ncbi:shikimate kinase [bacterium]|nr:shikimate kinase [bacterium]
MKQNNIVLTGLMGCGKTTVGNLLATSIDELSFVDTDDVIVETMGMSVNAIFEKYGENRFRQIEKIVILNLAEEENSVISLGGGAFEDDETRKTLLDNSTVFYLKASVDTLYERIKNDNSRPLLNTENPKQKLKELLDLREPHYNEAHYIIDTNSLSPYNIVKEIQRRLNEHAD